MTEDEIIKRMENIQSISALFDWLEMLDSHACQCTYDELIGSTCEMTFTPKSFDDVMDELGL